MEKKQIKRRHPVSESLRRTHLVKEEEEHSLQQLFIFFRIHLQAAALVLVSVQSRNTARLLHPRSLRLHLNNKLKAVKFRHCDYQCNYIIELKTELASCKMWYQNAGADITARVPQCARRLRMPEFKDFCAILGYNESWSLVPPKIGQFEVISLELLSKNASRFPLSTTTMIMVVQPIIIIFQNRGQIFMGTWWVRLITVIIFPRL